MRRYITTLLLLLGVATFVLGLHRLNVFEPYDRSILELRMGSKSRPSSGDIVFVAIDQRSIHEFNSWPWPRDIHADILDRLIQLDAAEIFFDIDFSTPSTQASDDKLTTALARAGGKALLPVFKQPSGVGPHAKTDTVTLPMEPFREHAWLVAVTLEPNMSGRVWHYPWGQKIDGLYYESAGAVMAGRSGPKGGDFLVNYGIDPSTISRISVVDLLGGEVRRNQIAGRSIVVGADAAELRDNIAVPGHGVLPGALVHILAAETLLANAILKPLRADVPFVVVVLLVTALSMSSLGTRPPALTAAFCTVSVAVELTAYALHNYGGIVLFTPTLHAIGLGSLFVMIARELSFRRWLAHGLRLDAGNTGQLYRHVVAATSDGILVVDESGRILEINGRAQALFGVDRGSLRTSTYTDILPQELSHEISEAMASLHLGHTIPGTRAVLHHNQNKALYLECSVTPTRLPYRGRTGDLDVPDIVAFVMIQDVTSTHAQQTQLKYLTHHDGLTGAYNRQGFLTIVREILMTEGCDVITLNIRRFKFVNSTLGRGVGDAILRELVRRLETSAPDPACIARLDGDTFSVGYPYVDVGPSQGIVDEITRALTEPFDVDGTKVHIRVRIGMSRANVGDDPADAIEQGQTAIDVGRGASKHAACHFEPSMGAGQARSRRLEKVLWEAIENDEIYLVYHPQVSILDGTVVGVEALARWKHPEMGDVSPTEFIPVAESSGFIDILGQWVLERACVDARTWSDDISISVNTSPRQFESGTYSDDVLTILSRTQLPPKRLCLEIGETGLASSLPEFDRVLGVMRGYGVSLTLDDFGGEVSSLGSLTRCSFDRGKDRSENRSGTSR